MSHDVSPAQQQAIDLVSGYYDAFNRGDWAGMLERLSADVAHDLNQGTRESGVEAFATFLQRMDASYREQLR
ncbi:MAG: nuclear transport factor 2 family protein, partial [Stenotrophomonas nitritireducens]|nr:nuclear transport factor 2 family protein [Stenotrophomonas nitritireducens]